MNLTMRGPLYTFLVPLVSNIIYLNILSQLVKESCAYRSTKHQITLCRNPSGQSFSQGSSISTEGNIVTALGTKASALDSYYYF